MNCSPALWADVVPLLPRDVEIHCPTLRGSTLDEAVRHLLDVAPENFTLVGLSLGGIVSMAVMGIAPHRVNALGLFDTNARPPTPEQISGWEETLHRLRKGESARSIQRSLLPVLLHQGALDGVVSATLEMGSETGEALLAEQLIMQKTRVDQRPGLSLITVPTTVLAGEDDLLCPKENHWEIANAVRGSRLVFVPQSGHLSPLEQPFTVAQEIKNLLEPCQ